MPRAKRTGQPTDGKPAKKIVVSVWVPDAAQKARLDRAVDLVQKRSGAPTTLSGWMLAVVMRAVEEEERLAGKKKR